MTKVDIISGFLGAGKTTLIKKLLSEGNLGDKVVLIENEFGEIGIDGGFLKDAGVQVTEMNSGCICCTLVGDFGKALNEVIETYNPERIIIEPSGVGKLSDVIKAVENLNSDKIELNSFTTVVDAGKCKMYLKNFGEFFSNQVQYAKTVILSRTQSVNQQKLEAAVNLLKEINPTATIITTPWDDISGLVILEAMQKKSTFEEDLLKQVQVCPECGHVHGEHGHHHHHHDEHCCCGHNHEHEHHHDHEHHHHDHDEHCCCGHNHEHEHHHDHEHHHHDHDEHCCCGHEHEHHHDHEHHHHDHDEHCCCGHDHEHHHHDHDEECSCGCGGHGHHHHHADEVFTSWGKETPKKYTKEELEDILEKLAESDDFGFVLRAKGIVPSPEGVWYHFDLTPGEYEIREGAADVTGRICVIGSKLKEAEITQLFGL
ncbi:MAG: GTP-binding protein [Lachnospiraceae bacterium]|nr:GTP-binding protein [Lachnospiraceae bacterium]